MQSFKQYLAESTYATSSQVTKIKKAVEHFITGKTYKERGMHFFRFEEKNYDAIHDILLKMFGKPIEKERKLLFYKGDLNIALEKPNPRLAGGYLSIDIFKQYSDAIEIS